MRRGHYPTLQPQSPDESTTLEPSTLTKRQHVELSNMPRTQRLQKKARRANRRNKARRRY